MVQFMTFRRTSGRNLAAVRRPHPRYAAEEVAVYTEEDAKRHLEDEETVKPKKTAKKADDDG